MPTSELSALLNEYAAATAYSVALVDVLSPQQVNWRPDQNSSAMGWHLGHQAAVNHFMVRNLTAAEVTFNREFDAVFDSATPETQRGDLPPIDEIVEYRQAIAGSTRRIVNKIDGGEVGAPKQLQLIASGMLTAIINHEYQHAKWIEEVRSTMTDEAAPTPNSERLVVVEGYRVVGVHP
jgi:hypothetical protein